MCFNEVNTLYAVQSWRTVTAAGASAPIRRLRRLAARVAARRGAGETLSYWRQHLEGAPALLELPTDKPRPAIQTFRGTNESLELSAELTAKLNELSRQHNVTLFMLLLAAFQLLLHRHTGQKDILGFGHRRAHVGTESLIGYFINTLARGRVYSRADSRRVAAAGARGDAGRICASGVAV